jgi:hypothetical protein
VTFTGNRLDVVEILGNENTIAELDAPVRALCAKRFTRDLPETGVSAGEPLGLTSQQIDKCLSVIDADSGHDEWLAVGMALHHETQGEGFDLWNDWSELGSKYPGREVLLHRWSSFGKTHDRTVTARSLVRLANEHGAGINLNGPATADEFEDLVGEASPEAAPGRFAIVPAHEFATGANPTWVIKDVLPQAELVVMYGASGSGKSFLALDMAAAIARGVEWRGKRVRQGRVAYIAAEGGGGFRKRLKAYGQHNEIDLASLELGVIHAAPNMMEAKDAADVVKAIKAWGGADIVIVDTFAQVMPGANENAGEDVGKALTHCKRIHELTGAMIILIHHAGKDASKGARGWSGLRAAADAELEVVREATGRSLRLTKSKDGEDGMAWGFDLEIITVGTDEDLDPITSCVVIEAQMPVPGAGPARKLGPVEKAVNDVIQEFAVAQTEGIEVGPVLAEAVKRIEPPADGKRDTRKQRARRALEALCAGDDAPYWIADDGCITIC